MVFVDSIKLNTDYKSKPMKLAKLTSRLLVPIVVTIALLFAAQSAQAATMPDADVPFGILAPGGPYTGTTDLPDDSPNVAWFQFALSGAAANVTLDTFGSGVQDTILALYDPDGTLLGQNDDCPPVGGSTQSCLVFSALQPASYLVGVVEYNAWFELSSGSLFELEFIDMWMLNDGNESKLGSESVTLNIQVEAVSPTVVPVPAALWLFGTALAGFIGFSRRKTV